MGNCCESNWGDGMDNPMSRSEKGFNKSTIQRQPKDKIQRLTCWGDLNSNAEKFEWPTLADIREFDAENNFWCLKELTFRTVTQG